MPTRHDLACKIAALRTHYIVLLVFTTAIYAPRLILSYLVFYIAQFLRLVARLAGVAGGRALANRRILIITDYLPPQTHGIAIRTAAYAKEMRAKGHEVVVFATAMNADKVTSFDHPNIPSVVNPFNLGNRIGYNPGVKLAWYLGALSWDVVHVVYPSLIPIFVLPLCAWRGIPVYCSHHVEMDMFGEKLVPVTIIRNFGFFMFYILAKWPAMKWATLNSAPTLYFARQYIGSDYEKTLRRIPSGTHDVFTPQPASASERAEVRKNRFGVESEDTRVVLMVQRLSGEKGTERAFPAFVPKDQGGYGLESILVIAGDGPAKKSLEAMVEEQGLEGRVRFLGNVPHHELPELYRAADCFVTMSLSETFGLTVLEAQMCGCPAAIPYCGVFDEIWGENGISAVPKSWRYDVKSTPELASAILAAQTKGREYLKEHPIRMTWSMAAEELLKQYEECIEMNKEKRQQLRNVVTFIDQFLRFAIGVAVCTWVLMWYYKNLKRFGNMVSPFR